MASATVKYSSVISNLEYTPDWLHIRMLRNLNACAFVVCEGECFCECQIELCVVF